MSIDVCEQTSKQKRKAILYKTELYSSSRGLIARILTENGISNNGGEAEEFEGRISKPEGLEGS